MFLMDLKRIVLVCLVRSKKSYCVFMFISCVKRELRRYGLGGGAVCRSIASEVEITTFVGIWNME